MWLCGFVAVCDVGVVGVVGFCGLLWAFVGVGVVLVWCWCVIWLAVVAV